MKYQVQVLEEHTFTLNLEVEASSPEEAEEKALKQAGALPASDLLWENSTFQERWVNYIEDENNKPVFSHFGGFVNEPTA